MAKDVSIFDGTAWVSIVGPPGADGVDGKDGSGVDIKGTAAAYPPAATPDVGDMWIVPDPVPAGFPAGTVAGDGLVWTGTEWNNVGGIRGPAGKDGADGADGAPGVDGAKGDKGDDGVKGDAGADGADGAKGDKGADGANGTVAIFTQDAPPSDTETGNLYVEYGVQIGDGPDGSNLYSSNAAMIATNNVWVDIKGNAGADGAKGDTGDKGDDGAAGADGRSVAVTVSPTQPATAAVGDFWIEPT
jgi:hypothetical protein